MSTLSQTIARLALSSVVLLMGLAPRAGFATEHFVDINSPGPSAPYTNWATAATNIQDAVDASAPGDVVWVTNGTYSMGGRTAPQSLQMTAVVIDRAITVQSVNGPWATYIAGQRATAGPVRCAYLTNGAVLSGFTLKNGSTTNNGDFLRDQSGGGVLCESSSAIISNCVITANAAAGNGGGIVSGTLYNCIITVNSASEGGGTASSTVYNSVFNGNEAAWGGGANGGSLSNCSLIGNTA